MLTSAGSGNGSARGKMLHSAAVFFNVAFFNIAIVAAGLRGVERLE
jgi:hypothetical protein